MPRSESRRDRWVSALQSVLLHSAIVGAIVLGWWAVRDRPRPQPTLALNAAVVSANALKEAEVRKPIPMPHRVPVKVTTPPRLDIPPPQEPISPPASTQNTSVHSVSEVQTVPVPADLAARVAAKRAAQAKADALRKAKQAAERRAEQRRLAEARRKAQERREAEERLAAEKKRLAEEKLKAELARRAAEAKALALNRANLSASISQEEQAMDARSAPALANWVQQITARIEHAWNRPLSAKPGIDCIVDVTQVPGGEIVNVKVASCNGDEAVVQSIQDAAYRASPLPPPPDPALFERHLQVEFKPN